jgi:hypothetical protein
VRGEKIMAWRVPKILFDGGIITAPPGSKVPYMQKRLLDATQNALAAVAEDVCIGFKLTVGLDAEWCLERAERTSVILHLPENADIDYVVEAVNLENLECWKDEQNRFHVAIGPWFTTKEVDHVVLCTIKIVHEYTGLLHADMAEHGHSHD